MQTTVFLRVVVFFFALVASPFSRADFVFSAPPRESAEQGHKIYDPFVTLLSDVLGERVVYNQPHDFAQYGNDMRAGKYDIVFDGPHFASWRIKHLGHVPIARIPGSIEFMVLTRKDNKRINNSRDLVSQGVCALASPNLGTTAMLAQFPNPVLQPEIVEIKGGFDEVYQAFKAGQCRAAVVRDNVFKKLSDADKQGLKVVFRSKTMPNQTVTVSDRVKLSARNKLASALTTKTGPAAAEAIFIEFSKTAHYFTTTRASEFDDLNHYLEGVVWGW